ASHESEPTDRAREERVAKAIFEAVEQDPFYSWEMLSADNPDRFDCLKQARAALAALIYPAPATPESERRQEALSIVLIEITVWEEDERVNYPDDEVLESLDRIRDALASPEAMRG